MNKEKKRGREVRKVKIMKMGFLQGILMASFSSPENPSFSSSIFFLQNLCALLHSFMGLVEVDLRRFGAGKSMMMTLMRMI